jgi:hypothetical protein
MVNPIERYWIHFDYNKQNHQRKGSGDKWTLCGQSYS